MNQTKQASPDHPIHEFLAKRWSPYGFADRPVSAADIRSLFEAARWAASSYNEQPWSYLVATKETPEEFTRLLSCLVEANQAWAKAAPVLAIGCTSLFFKKNGRPMPQRSTIWAWPPGISAWKQPLAACSSMR